jgi:hypothetical protein
MSHELNVLLVESITMNTKKKLVSIVLLTASITTVIISAIGLVAVLKTVNIMKIKKESVKSTSKN